jgi:hypothetical protein
VPPIVQQKAKEETKEADASAVNASGNTEWPSRFVTSVA